MAKAAGLGKSYRGLGVLLPALLLALCALSLALSHRLWQKREPHYILDQNAHLVQNEAKTLWVAHVSVPLFDIKGADHYFLSILKAVGWDRHRLVYLAYREEPGQEEYHTRALIEASNATVVTGSPAKACKDARQVAPCDTAVLFFWPTTDYWEWLGKLTKEIREQQPACEVVILLGEPFWPRWKALQDAHAIDMEDVPWITKRWDLLRANMLKYLQTADKLAFASEQDADLVAQLLPAKRGATFVLPYLAEVQPAEDEPAAPEGLLFICGAQVEHAPYLRTFLPQLMAGLPAGVGDLHVVGTIFQDMNLTAGEAAAWTRIKLHSHLSESELVALERRVLACINPIEMAGGISTKVVRAMASGRPVAATHSALPSEARRLCKGAVLACSKGEVACFQRSLERLLRDPQHWKEVSDCGLRFVRERLSKQALQTALRNLLRKPRPPVEPLALGSGVYIAAILANVETKWNYMQAQLLTLIRTLLAQQRAVCVVVVTNNNVDKTEELLTLFSQVLSSMGVLVHITLAKADKASERNQNRARYLAALRNQALQHLTLDYGTTLFINDVYVTAEDLLALIDTPADYDMVCGLDFSRSAFTLNANLTATESPEQLCFYDIWVARDISGQHFTSHFPWAQAPGSVAALLEGRPFQVYSCWNGAVAFRSAAYLLSGLRFRSTEGACPASECHLWCKDLWALGYSRIYVNPQVQSAYEWSVYREVQATDYYRKLHNPPRSLQERRPLMPPADGAPSSEGCCQAAPGGPPEPDWGRCSYQPNDHPTSLAIVGNILGQDTFSETSRGLFTGLKQGYPKNMLAMLSVRDDPFSFLTDLDGPAGMYSNAGVSTAVAPRFDIAVHVSWPPILERHVSAQKTVIMLPWEFGSLPATWVPLLNKFDQVWVPATALKEQFAADGIDPFKLQVVPPSVPDRFLRGGQQGWDFASGKRFNLLYVGPVSHSRGTDALLRAYKEEFSASEDVCLVLVSDAVEDAESQALLQAWREDPAKPCLDWRQQVPLRMKDTERMMTSASAYVAPHRAKDFDLRPLQAMALGTPVIATRGGAFKDYFNDDVALMVDSSRVNCTHPPCQGMLLCAVPSAEEPCLAAVKQPAYWEPDHLSLRSALRAGFVNASELQSRSAAAKVWARYRFSVDVVTATAVSALRELGLR